MAFPVTIRLMWRGKVIRGDNDRPEGVTIRAWRSITKAANRAMGFEWHTKFFPLHFGSGALRRYGSKVYKVRSTIWLARKLKIFAADVNRIAQVSPGDNKEERQRKRMMARQQLVEQAGGVNYNVYTGTLQQMTRTVIMRAFPGRFRLEMPTPSYIPGRRRDPTQPDIRAELTHMLSGEADHLRKIGQRVLTQSVRQLLKTGSLPAGV